MRQVGNNLALVFPGQGAQAVGMGRDLYDASPAARAIFDQADRSTKRQITRLCFEGPVDELMDTANAQPAIVATSVAALAALREALEERDIDLQPSFTAGHSVGQYSALVAAGVLDFCDAVALVTERGRLMKEAGELQPGGMAAVLGIDAAAVERACGEAAGIVQAANYNLSTQTVISGDREGLAAATALLLQRGAKKVMPLSVSVANHSPLMAPASEAFAALLDSLTLRDAAVPVVTNSGARAVTSRDDTLAELRHHMTSPVRWTQTLDFIASQGVNLYWELGPGQVLAGLIKRSGQGASAMSIGSHAGVIAAASMLATGVLAVV